MANNNPIGFSTQVSEELLFGEKLTNFSQMRIQFILPIAKTHLMDKKQRRNYKSEYQKH
jgi:hypothetical protein